ncbi:MAG TPA: flagellar hook capping FlgD N-terminal domain-containing protein, partial [Tepidisphaeraceae bacterium]|nr:flagellar hook capping FlgD N-terminal domain-containing protein [Tepidisphaeraceae bacterium]
TTAAKKSGMGKLEVGDFINMMVTQLQNQDPLEPTKNEDLLAQMSQIGQLQTSQSLQDAMGEMVSNNKSLMDQLTQQNNISSAGSLIGKQVSGKNDEGDLLEGLVTSVNVKPDGVVELELDSGQMLPLGKVTQIGNAVGTVVAQ